MNSTTPESVNVENKSSSKAQNDDDANKFLIEEYKLLWAYYLRNLDERHKCIEYFYRMVVLPSGLISAMIVYLKGPDFGHRSILIISALLFTTISIVGFISYTIYIKEASNGTSYLRALRDIRQNFRSRSSILSESLTIDNYRPRDLSERYVKNRSISMWRSDLISSVNSIIIVLSIVLLSGDYHDFGPNFFTKYIFLYILTLLIHILWGRYVFSSYQRREAEEQKKRPII